MKKLILAFFLIAMAISVNAQKVTYKYKYSYKKAHVFTIDNMTAKIEHLTDQMNQINAG